MKILSFVIPKSLQEDRFILSIENQFKRTGKLTKRQRWALLDTLDIDEDFYDWHFECAESTSAAIKSDYSDLKEKLIRNKFRSVGTRNRCIRAMESIICGCPNYSLITATLRPIPFHQQKYKKFRTW